MIVLIPLRDLTLFTRESPDTLSEDEVVARIRADHPALFAGAKISVADVLRDIEHGRGSAYDPAVVDAFFNLFRERQIVLQ